MAEWLALSNGRLAQRLERKLDVFEVTGSSPVPPILLWAIIDNRANLQMGKEKLEYKIRKPKEEDIPQIMEIGKSTTGVSPESSFWSEEQIKRWIKSGDVLLVAEIEGEVIGLVFSQFNKPTGKATIENLIVKEEYRNRGIGTDLLNQCLDKLKAKGAAYICALVKTDNKPTIEFILKQGFHRGYDFTWLEKII